MGGPEVLGATTVTWIKQTAVPTKVAKEVVGLIWPKINGVRKVSPHPGAVTSCDSITDLIAELESWVRSCRTRCVTHLTLMPCICNVCQSRMCLHCHDTDKAKVCHRCLETFPTLAPRDRQCEPRQGQPRCLNVHALGEEWIANVTSARKANGSPDRGENLQFLAHVKGWRTIEKAERCALLLRKTDHNLRTALLSGPVRDFLLIPHEWYPDDTPPKFESPGWYVPAEEVMIRKCQNCEEYREFQEYTSLEWSRKGQAKS
jgi:hypothetical protein